MVTGTIRSTRELSPIDRLIYGQVLTNATFLADECDDCHGKWALVGRYSDDSSLRTVRLRRSSNAWG